jgi:hypothetical protein
MPTRECRRCPLTPLTWCKQQHVQEFPRFPRLTRQYSTCLFLPLLCLKILCLRCRPEDPEFCHTKETRWGISGTNPDCPCTPGMSCRRGERTTCRSGIQITATFLTSSPGSVLFSRSNLLKRKDLCFSCLRLGLMRHRRSLRSSHLFSSGLPRFCRVTTRARPPAPRCAPYGVVSLCISIHLFSSAPCLSLIFLESLEYFIELYLVNCILDLLLSILSKRFRCSNESNQKAIRDRSSKVETLNTCSNLQYKYCKASF